MIRNRNPILGVFHDSAQTTVYQGSCELIRFAIPIPGAAISLFYQCLSVWISGPLFFLKLNQSLLSLPPFVFRCSIRGLFPLLYIPVSLKTSQPAKSAAQSLSVTKLQEKFSIPYPLPCHQLSALRSPLTPIRPNPAPLTSTQEGTHASRKITHPNHHHHHPRCGPQSPNPKPGQPKL